LNNLTKVA